MISEVPEIIVFYNLTIRSNDSLSVPPTPTHVKNLPQRMREGNKHTSHWRRRHYLPFSFFEKSILRIVEVIFSCQERLVEKKSFLSLKTVT